MSSGEEEQIEKKREEGRRNATSDRALVRLDEKEILARMTEAWQRFIQLGFAAHVVGVKVRSAIQYTIMLYPDGIESIPSEMLQEVADEFRLDYDIERDSLTQKAVGWAIVLYPRW